MDILTKIRCKRFMRKKYGLHGEKLNNALNEVCTCLKSLKQGNKIPIANQSPEAAVIAALLWCCYCDVEIKFNDNGFTKQSWIYLEWSFSQISLLIWDFLLKNINSRYICIIWRINIYIFIWLFYYFNIFNFNNWHFTMIISFWYFTSYFNPTIILNIFSFFTIT